MSDNANDDKYRIMGRYRGGKVEQLDSASDHKEVEYLLQEYRLAYGAGWSIWVSGGLVHID